VTSLGFVTARKVNVSEIPRYIDFSNKKNPEIFDQDIFDQEIFDQEIFDREIFNQEIFDKKIGF